MLHQFTAQRLVFIVPVDAVLLEVAQLHRSVDAGPGVAAGVLLVHAGLRLGSRFWKTVFQLKMAGK